MSTFLQQQSPSCTSSYQSCASDHFLAPATTSSYQSWTSDHLPAPADTILEPATTFQHQQIPVLHQRPPVQWLPVFYQLSRPAPATKSCSSNHHLAMVTVHRTLFQFMICQNKFWPFKAKPLFCHSCLVRCQSIIFQMFVGTGIFIGLCNRVLSMGQIKLFDI